MIDLHCHILPQVDDGSQSLKDSLDMARLAAESGVTAVAATPHCVDGGATVIRERVLLLREALEEAQIPLRLYMGMEIFGTSYTAELLSEGRLMTLNGSRYPLIEFRFDGTGERETAILREVISAGFQPLVAHPERYGYIQEDPELANLWKEMGCLFQINRGSLLGRFGTGARRMALELTFRGFATVVASDGHSPRMRTPWMKDISDFLRQEISDAAEEYLLKKNPKAILRNQALDPVIPEWF